ncbi:hypothetical protein PENTCL1PPCAC_16835 [Pristionchus entomophagus]|uniref:Uncharacterized protein n=1 Tax=Pristionchus entomophagus TaxID=358040 RepID=A0AAV5TJY0_9BILA|nr:hypothetical protein PENTCL1PPCAC_16835 [Pristionchus entomophagus]
MECDQKIRRGEDCSRFIIWCTSSVFSSLEESIALLYRTLLGHPLYSSPNTLCKRMLQSALIWIVPLPPSPVPLSSSAALQSFGSRCGDLSCCRRGRLGRPDRSGAPQEPTFRLCSGRNQVSRWRSR